MTGRPEREDPRDGAPERPVPGDDPKSAAAARSQSGSASASDSGCEPGSELIPGDRGPGDGGLQWSFELDLAAALESIGRPLYGPADADQEEILVAELEAMDRLEMRAAAAADGDNVDATDGDGEGAGAGAGNASGGDASAGSDLTGLIAEHLPTGPGLAAWLSQRTPAELADRDLPGAAAAFRKMASWAQAAELATIAQIAARSAAKDDKVGLAAGGRPAAVTRDATAQVSLGLALSPYGAESWAHLAVTLEWRLPATAAALFAGDIDLYRAQVIADAVGPLSDEAARAVEDMVLPAAGHQTYSQLHAAVRRAVIAADPEGAEQRREAAERRAKVSLYPDQDHTAALTGSRLPAVPAAAAMARVSAMARALKASGAGGGIDLLRAQVFLGLLMGTLPDIPPRKDGPPDSELPPDDGRSPHDPHSPDDPHPTDNEPPGGNGKSDGSGPPAGPGPAPRGHRGTAGTGAPGRHGPRSRGSAGGAPDSAGNGHKSGDRPGTDAGAGAGAGADAGGGAGADRDETPGHPSHADPPSYDDAKHGDKGRAGPSKEGSAGAPPDANTGPPPDANTGPPPDPNAGPPSGGGGAGPPGDRATGVPRSSSAGPPGQGIKPDPSLEPQPTGADPGHHPPPTGADRDPSCASPQPDVPWPTDADAPEDDGFRDSGPPLPDGYADEGGYYEGDPLDDHYASSDPVPAWPVVPVSLPAPDANASRPAGTGRPPAGLLDVTLAWQTLTCESLIPGSLGRIGPITATQARSLARIAGTDHRTQWRVILTDPDGHALAVGRVPRFHPPDDGLAPPPTASLVGRVTVTIPAAVAASAQPPGTGGRADGWADAHGSADARGILTAILRTAARTMAQATVQALADQKAPDGCAHTTASPTYRPPPRIREYVIARDLTCRFPYCGQPAWRGDLDHTRAWHKGGRTCRCNLGPLCRAHHLLKQMLGWTLSQPQPGIFQWTTPAGCVYAVGPDGQCI
jgi:hypothetical protein